MANLLQVNLCLAHQAVSSENNPHSKGKQMSSFGLVTPKGFLLRRLHLNIIVSKQVPCSTLCGSFFLWIFNWKSRRGMSCGSLHHTPSLPWGFFCSARSLWDEEAATAFAKLQYFLALPEPQTQTWGNSLWVQQPDEFQNLLSYIRRTAQLHACRHDAPWSHLHWPLPVASLLGHKDSAFRSPSLCSSFTPAKPIGKPAHAGGFYRDREPRIRVI